MFARFSTLHCNPEVLDDVVQSVHVAVTDTMQIATGFVDSVIVVSRTTGRCHLLTTWQAQTDLADSRNAEQQYLAQLLPKLRDEPRSQHYEVLVNASTQLHGNYARVITLPVLGKHLDAARAIYEQQYLPLLQRQAGFLGVVWLADRARGDGWGISFWADAKHMQAADQDGEFFPQVLGRLAPYFSRPTAMAYYTVAAKP